MNTTLALIAATIGFAIAAYIFYTKRKKKPLMCPRKSPCETVVEGPYAKTFGIPNDILGMIYYALVSFLFFHGGVMVGLMLIVVSAGFLFSLYLVGIQYFVIKHWCWWCLGSALMATILFVSTLVSIV